MTALFALGLLICIMGAMKALTYLLVGYDEREWEIHTPIFPVRTISGERLSERVMRRKIDGKRQYRKCSAEELKQAIEDEENEMPLV